jgi:hypothetical protein
MLAPILVIAIDPRISDAAGWLASGHYSRQSAHEVGRATPDVDGKGGLSPDGVDLGGTTEDVRSRAISIR